MECNEAHLAKENAILDLCYQFIIYFFVSAVTPPKEDVCLFKKLVGQSLVLVIECRESYLKVIIFVEKALYGCVKTVGIDSLDVIVFLFVAELVPYYNIYFAVHKKYLPFRISLYKAVGIIIQHRKIKVKRKC